MFINRRAPVDRQRVNSVRPARVNQYIYVDE